VQDVKHTARADEEWELVREDRGEGDEHVGGVVRADSAKCGQHDADAREVFRDDSRQASRNHACREVLHNDPTLVLGEVRDHPLVEFVLLLVARILQDKDGHGALSGLLVLLVHDVLEQPKAALNGDRSWDHTDDDLVRDLVQALEAHGLGIIEASIRGNLRIERCGCMPNASANAGAYEAP
jgi:hypothetical protein